MAVAVQVGRLPQLGPSVYRDPARISPISSLQVAGPNTGRVGGIFGGSISSEGPNCCGISRDRGLFHKVFLCCK